MSENVRATISEWQWYDETGATTAIENIVFDFKDAVVRPGDIVYMIVEGTPPVYIREVCILYPKESKYNKDWWCLCDTNSAFNNYEIEAENIFLNRLDALAALDKLFSVQIAHYYTLFEQTKADIKPTPKKSLPFPPFKQTIFFK